MLSASEGIVTAELSVRLSVTLWYCIVIGTVSCDSTRPVFFRYCCTVLIHGPYWLTIYADCSRSIWDANVSYWVSNGRIM